MIALLNSRWAESKAKIENENYSFKKDGIGLYLKNSFTNIVSFVHKYLAFMQRDKHFLIVVKLWNPEIFDLRIATLSSNLYKRDITSVNIMSATAALEFLKTSMKLQRD